MSRRKSRMKPTMINAPFNLAVNTRINEIRKKADRLNDLVKEVQDRNRTPINIIETEVRTKDGEEHILFELKDHPEIDGLIVSKEHIKEGTITRFMAYEKLGEMYKAAMEDDGQHRG